jgi:hypothetical protein
LNARRAVPAIVLIALFVVSIFFEADLGFTVGAPDFFVGVEFAYSNGLNDSQVNVNSLKLLVDKVENYTNLFVIGIPEISLNQTALTESCDYISSAGLHFIVLFTDITTYSYAPLNWTNTAKQKYGEKFLGVYRLDEPGGKELENNATERFLNPNDFNPKVANYTGASQEYVGFLQQHVSYFHQVLYSTLVTSDFGLYWFDYQGGYDTVFAEFVWNQSRQMAISLCRGAANSHDKNWGVTVTWMYDKEPYIESGQQLYNDLTLAYTAGAKYAIVFDYPNSTQYGILKQEHFDALKNFWDYQNKNPQAHGASQGKVAYVLPEGYGFGFRGPNDTIWGIWSSDDLSSKIWGDVSNLMSSYGPNLDIVYNDPQYIDAITSKYDRLFFWNKTIN